MSDPHLPPDPGAPEEPTPPPAEDAAPHEADAPLHPEAPHPAPPVPTSSEAPTAPTAPDPRPPSFGPPVAPFQPPPSFSAPVAPYQPPASFGAPAHPGAQSYPGAPPQAQPFPGAPPQAQPYPGAPPQAQPYPGAPPQAYSPFAPGVAVGERSKVLALVAIGLAGLGLIMAFIPFMTFVAGLVLLGAFIVAIVALVSKNQGAKGLSIAALIVSVVGWIVSAVVAITSIWMLPDLARPPYEERPPTVETKDPYTPPGTTGAMVEDLIVVESAFGPSASDNGSWWYAVVVENPNTDYTFDFEDVNVEAMDKDGTILKTDTTYLTIPTGKTVFAGTFYDLGSPKIASLNIRLPPADDAVASLPDDAGEFVFEDVRHSKTSYATSVEGTVSGSFTSDLEYVVVVVTVRDSSGQIVAASNAYIDRLPANGGKVRFKAHFRDDLPVDAKYEAFGQIPYRFG